MAHDHSFDCQQCGAHLDSKEDLNKHMRDKHSAQASNPSSSQSSSSGSGSGSSSTRRKE